MQLYGNSTTYIDSFNLPDIYRPESSNRPSDVYLSVIIISIDDDGFVLEDTQRRDHYSIDF